MNLRLPWWSKVGAKIVLSRLPFGYAAWQALGVFRHGRMDVPDYAINVFHSHAERAGLDALIGGKTVLELGPGDSVASAIVAAAHGARAILVDTGRYARGDVARYLDLEHVLTGQGLSPPGLSGCRDIAGILDVCDARYMTQGLESIGQIESGSVHLIFSQAVLEHVRRREFLETMRECRRILAPGGICSHRVDLRDHLGGALNNLRFPERWWEADWFARSGFYTNRIGFSEMLRLFGEAGFATEVRNVERWKQLPTQREEMSAPFRTMPEEELCVSGFDVLLRSR